MSSNSTAPPGWRPDPRTPTPLQTVGRTHRSGSAASLSYTKTSVLNFYGKIHHTLGKKPNMGSKQFHTELNSKFKS